MKRLFLISIFCAAIFTVAAQKIVSVSGEHTYYAPSTMSLEQAKQEALLQTRLKVLADRFGTIVNSTTNITLSNSETDQTRSLSEVHTLATHEVKGEWIEDTREPVQEISYDRSMRNTTIITTRVWGKAREILTAKAQVDVHLLKDTLSGADADVFHHEQSFYLSLQSPVAGYAAVYLLDEDEDMAYCLLPAADDERGAIPVTGNRRYVFFSSEYARRYYTKADELLGTEYMFTTERSVSYSQIYVLFSPQQFYKANDEAKAHEQYSLPRATQLKNFRQWLTQCKIRDTQLVENIFTVKIVK